MVNNDKMEIKYKLHGRAQDKSNPLKLHQHEPAKSKQTYNEWNETKRNEAEHGFWVGERKKCVMSSHSIGNDEVFHHFLG